MRAVAPRLGKGTAVFAHLFGRQIVNIGPAVADQLFGPAVKLIEIVGRVFDIPVPANAEPGNIRLDRIDKFLIFFRRVGIVETQIAMPAEFRGYAEIEADRFRVSDMQIAIGLGWKTGDNGLNGTVGQVFTNPVADKIASFAVSA